MAAREAWHVGRTMRVLELLAFAPLSAPQLAAAMDAHPRTVRRVLERLVAEDYLTRSDDARRIYTPTMRLVALAGQVVEHSDLARRARPYAALLHERTARSRSRRPELQPVLCVVHCAGDARDSRRACVSSCPPTAPPAGRRCSRGATAWRESVLAEPLARFTGRTVVDPAALRAQLAAVRDGGRAVEDGEYQAGVRAVAAPVLAADGQSALAALSVSGRGLDSPAWARTSSAAPPTSAGDLRGLPCGRARRRARRVRHRGDASAGRAAAAQRRPDPERLCCARLRRAGRRARPRRAGAGGCC